MFGVCEYSGAMNWQAELMKSLKCEWESARVKNPRFSVRGYAARLEVSPSTLSQLLRSQPRWNIKVDLAQHIVARMSLPEPEKKRLWTMMGISSPVTRLDLGEQNYDFLLNWSYPAILFCHELAVEERGAERISSRLKLDVDEVKKAIADLLKRGLLRVKEGSDYLERNPNPLTAGDGPSSEVIREHHKNNLSLALDMIEEVPKEQRDYTSMTFVGSMERMEDIRKEIRQFHEKIVNLMNGGKSNDEVFRLSVALFPMRRSDESSS